MRPSRIKYKESLRHIILRKNKNPDRQGFICEAKALDYSVLMTVYKKDSPEFFIQSVQSMLNQTVVTNDYVLVCDGEITAELEEAIKTTFAGHEEILNLVRLPENVGLGMALHTGLPLREDGGDSA